MLMIFIFNNLFIICLFVISHMRNWLIEKLHYIVKVVRKNWIKITPI
jgi:hypothetical protein